MKKKTVLALIAAVGFLTCALLLPDGAFMWTIAFMAMLIVGAMRTWRSGMTGLTRWAKAHPRKAQWFIAGIQIILMVSGLVTGFNLKELGFTLTNTTAYIFSGIMGLGFLSVHFLPKRSWFAIPKEVETQRLGFLAITLSSLVMVVFTGNRVSSAYPDLFVSHLLQRTDQAIFGVPDTKIPEQDFSMGMHYKTAIPLALASLRSQESTDPGRAKVMDKTSLRKMEKAEKQMKREERKLERAARKDARKWWRWALAGGMCALGIFLIILLVGTVCAGICMLAFAVSGDIAAGYGVLGAVITGLSIWGMVEAIKLCKTD